MCLIAKREIVLASEFAAVSIWVDERGNGMRLRIRDLSEDMEIYLDPLELALIAGLGSDRLIEAGLRSSHYGIFGGTESSGEHAGLDGKLPRDKAGGSVEA